MCVTYSTVDLPTLSGGALQPVVAGLSRRVALEDLPASLGWFVGRQPRSEGRTVLLCLVEKLPFGFYPVFYHAISLVLQSLLQAVPEVSAASSNVAELKATACSRWSLRTRHPREIGKDRTGAVSS